MIKDLFSITESENELTEVENLDGLVDVLEWGKAHGHISDSSTKPNLPLSKIAARYGYLPLLEWLHDNELLSQEEFQEVICSGNLKLADWFFEMKYPLFRTIDMFKTAGMNKKIATWLIEHGILWTDEVSNNFLKWANGINPDWSLVSVWTESPCSLILQRGSIEQLRWAIAKGCPVDEQSFASIKSEEQRVILDMYRSSMCK